MKTLHFADAHIDTANYGRHDPQTGLPVRVMDFLRSLDAIIDGAIAEKVELAIFAGDAFKDRAPLPTFQREWAKRIMRLSDAGIPTILLVGNHDISPSAGRANTLENFATFKVPNVIVVAKPKLLTPQELGVNAQVIAIPWVNRSSFIAGNDIDPDAAKVSDEIEVRVESLVKKFIEDTDPAIPVILTAHASVQGAVQSSGMAVMLGNELVLPTGLVRDTRLDYVALGHIHKAQNLNENAQPPVIYPGSIERVDFGEATDLKGYVIADVQKGSTTVDTRVLNTRKFIDRHVKLEKPENITGQLEAVLGDRDGLTDAMVRLVVEYPSDMATLIDERAIRAFAEKSLEFSLIKRPLIATRVRLPEGKTAEAMTPGELLDLYFDASHLDATQELKDMAILFMGADPQDQLNNLSETI